MTSAAGLVSWLFSSLRRAYLAFDRRKCRSRNVWEFDSADECVLRLSAEHARESRRLADGHEVRAGDRLLRLHYWNEHIPPKDEGATMAWAARFGRRMRASMHGVGRHLRARRDLDDVVAIVGETSVLSADDVRPMQQFYGRLGFEVELLQPATLRARIHQMLRNIHVWLLIWAVNPASVRGRSPAGLQRIRMSFSREAFLARYGAEEHGRA